MPKKFPPRPGDLPRAALLKAARDAVDFHSTHGTVCNVHFKFTCPECGERCTLSEPNTLRERGECFSCGIESPIERGGFLISLSYPGGVQ